MRRAGHGARRLNASTRDVAQVGNQVLVEEHEAHEQPEHGAAERLGQPARVMRRPRDEGPIRPEPAVGDEQVPVRHRAEECRAEPLRPERQPPGVATWAEGAALMAQLER